MTVSYQPYELSVEMIVRSHLLERQDPQRVMDHYLSRCTELNPKINALSFFDEKIINSQVMHLRDRLKTGGSLPLAGVPIAIKDNICTEMMPTTCGSKFLQGFIPIYNATAVERLMAAGAIIFAKANMDEFAMGSSNEHSATGPVRNPWDLMRVPGGSSGGSAACVAADMVPAALGSDTGGSIRQPASFCGAVGFKPSYGAVSRYGLVAFASSFDQIGPLTRTVRDAAVLSSVLFGYDQKDATSRMDYSFDQMNPASWSKFQWQGKRVARIRNLSEMGPCDPGVEKNQQDFAAKLQELGAQLVEVDLPLLDKSLAIYYLIATAEASSNLARFDGVRFGQRRGDGKSLASLYRQSRSEGFGEEVKRRIMLGTYVLTSGYYDAYYSQALKARKALAQQLNAAFTNCDMIMLPTAPTPAFRLGEKTNDPLTMYLSDVYTMFANLVGLPAISIPSGFSDDGLPLGMQLVGPMGSDVALLQGADSYEQATNWWQQRRPEP